MSLVESTTINRLQNMSTIDNDHPQEPLQKKMVFTGAPAIVVILLYVVYMAMGYKSMSSSFDPEGIKAVESYISADYYREPVAQLNKNFKQGTRQDRLEAMSKEVQSLTNVEIVSADLKGFDSKDLIAKVEIEVDGNAPADGRRYRYFNVSYSWLTGWRVEGETTATLYKLKL